MSEELHVKLANIQRDFTRTVLSRIAHEHRKLRRAIEGNASVNDLLSILAWAESELLYVFENNAPLPPLIDRSASAGLTRSHIIPQEPAPSPTAAFPQPINS